ncbi:MAG: nucleotidyltransferase family protein [Chloroflexota bacterium]|nr:nucleotidyltransferase family protein [Chloroflexota bacterium]
MAHDLLELAGVRAGAGLTAERLAAWDADRWAAVLRAAQVAGLTATIESRLRRAGLLAGLPPAVQTAWRTERRRGVVAFAAQGQLLARLGAAFAAAAVPLRLLKGLALAHTVYPEPPARHVGDIDLWVAPADLPRALALLPALGLVMPQWDSRPSPFLQTFGKEVLFQPAGDPPPFLMVDLHWHPTAPWWLRSVLHIPEEQLFAAGRPVLIGKQTYLTLAPTEMLFYLCLHTALGHRYEGLRWLVDLAAVLDGGGVDWARLNALIACSGTGVIIWRALDLLDGWLGRRTVAHLRRLPGRLHRRLVRRFLPGYPAERSLRADAEFELRVPWEQLVLLPGLRAVGQALALLLWPPPVWLRLRYSLSPAAPVWRARLRHLGRVRRLLPGARKT